MADGNVVLQARGIVATRGATARDSVATHHAASSWQRCNSRGCNS